MMLTMFKSQQIRYSQSENRRTFSKIEQKSCNKSSGEDGGDEFQESLAILIGMNR